MHREGRIPLLLVAGCCVVGAMSCRDAPPAPTSVSPEPTTSAAPSPSASTSTLETTTAQSSSAVGETVASQAVPTPSSSKTTTKATATATAIPVASVTPAVTTTAPSPSAVPTASTTSTAIVSTPSTTGAHYAVWMQGATAKVGAPSFVDIVLVPQGGYHCNAAYPHKFKLGAPSAGVTYPQPVVTTIAYGEKRTTMRVPFVATSAGIATIQGKFTFAVCTADTCEPANAQLSIAVKVE